MIKNITKLICVFLLVLAVNINFASAAANFQVNSFSCSPTEVAINSAFSCTATIQNTGDASGTLNTATLYPDASDWLESSNYPQSYGQSVNAGNSISVTFSGMRSTKSGNNGFARIMLDSVTDTYVADNNKKVNVIDVVVIVSNSASSAAMGGTVTSTAEVTAGGNIDVSLSFTSNSGGCSIGSQTNPKTISGMTDGSKQSQTFTITQGTSGNCKYTISAAATGSGGVATKTDSTSSTITCTNCPTGGSSSSSSGGGGGGGGGSSTKIYAIGSLATSQMVELLDGEKASFEIFGENHTLTLKNHTNTSATITIESEKQTFTMNINDEINVDLNSDKILDILVKLKEINPATNKATIIISSISQGQGSGSTGPGTGGEPASPTGKTIGDGIGKLFSGENKIIIYIIIALVVIAIISGVIYLIERKHRKRRWGWKMIEKKEKIALVTFLSSIFLIIILLFTGFDNPTGYVINNVSDSVSQIESQSMQKSCVDSDGKDYGIKGNVNYCKDGECSVKSDSCSGKTLIELLCENEEIRSEEYLCEFDCDSGVCVNKVTKMRYFGSSGSDGGGSDGETSSSGSSVVSETQQIYDLGTLDSEKSVEIMNNDIIEFTLSGLKYNMVLQSLSQTKATLSISSLSNSIIIDVGKTQSVDLNSDGNSDISIKVKSINVISNKVKLFLTP